MQESSRDQHQVYFENNESVRVEMPKQGSTVEFKMDRITLKSHLQCTQILNRSLNQWTLWNQDLPINLIPMKLINTHHLVGVFRASLLTEMLMIR